MLTCKRHKKKKNCIKEIPSSSPKKTRTESKLKTNKCHVEEITCKIDSGKLETSLFGFKTHSME
jgi:hypothetical protein